MPDNFIPTTKQFKLINQINHIIITKTLHYLTKLPPEFTSVGISINLSGMSIGDDNMLTLIKNKLQKTNINPQHITFKITKTTTYTHITKTTKFITHIHQLNYHISLNNFSVSFSSFSYLKNLHINTLKINNNFIHNINHNHNNQLFIKTLINITHNIKIHTITKFIKTTKYIKLLQHLNINYIQNYFINQPTNTITQLQLIPPKTNKQNHTTTN